MYGPEAEKRVKTLKNEAGEKKNQKKFGCLRKNVYLCTRLEKRMHP